MMILSSARRKIVEKTARRASRPTSALSSAPAGALGGQAQSVELNAAEQSTVLGGRKKPGLHRFPPHEVIAKVLFDPRRRQIAELSPVKGERDLRRLELVEHPKIGGLGRVAVRPVAIDRNGVRPARRRQQPRAALEEAQS